MLSPRSLQPWITAALIALACWGCGGGGGTSPAPPPTTTPPPPPTSSNPCATALAADEDLAFVNPTNSTPEADRKRANVRGQTKIDRRDALWTHLARRERERVGLRAEVADPTAVTVDVGEIAVIEDDGTIFLTSSVSAWSTSLRARVNSRSSPSREEASAWNYPTARARARPPIGSRRSTTRLQSAGSTAITPISSGDAREATAARPCGRRVHLRHRRHLEPAHERRGARLEAGDAIYFDATTPHAYRRSGGRRCSAVVVTAS